MKLNRERINKGNPIKQQRKSYRRSHKMKSHDKFERLLSVVKIINLDLFGYVRQTQSNFSQSVNVRRGGDIHIYTNCMIVWSLALRCMTCWKTSFKLLFSASWNHKTESLHKIIRSFGVVEIIEFKHVLLCKANSVKFLPKGGRRGPDIQIC
jgi:hypothetical protein